MQKFQCTKETCAFQIHVMQALAAHFLFLFLLQAFVWPVDQACVQGTSLIKKPLIVQSQMPLIRAGQQRVASIKPLCKAALLQGKALLQAKPCNLSPHLPFTLKHEVVDLLPLMPTDANLVSNAIQPIASVLCWHVHFLSHTSLKGIRSHGGPGHTVSQVTGLCLPAPGLCLHGPGLIYYGPWDLNS